MLKRLTWFTMGGIAGVGGSVWAQRKVRRQLERYLPEQVVRSAAGTARALGSTVGAAVREGREAMRAREAELQGRLPDRPASAPLAAPPHRPRPDPAVARRRRRAPGRARRP